MMFAGIELGQRLRRSHEIAHQKRYRVVFRLRPDVLFGPGPLVWPPAHGNEHVWAAHCWAYRAVGRPVGWNDKLFFGPAAKMDRLLHLYKWAQLAHFGLLKGEVVIASLFADALSNSSTFCPLRVGPDGRLGETLCFASRGPGRDRAYFVSRVSACRDALADPVAHKLKSTNLTFRDVFDWYGLPRDSAITKPRLRDAVGR